MKWRWRVSAGRLESAERTLETPVILFATKGDQLTLCDGPEVGVPAPTARLRAEYPRPEARAFTDLPAGRN